MKYNYYTCARATGDKIEGFDTLEEALKAIKKYEISDKEEDIFDENWYQVYDTQKDEFLD